ncbi:MAG: nucleoside-diphosphate kinase [Patescibacteria group bacterium]|jgi:nucleoside-diphosphate kinase
MEQTLIVLKPDTVARGLVGEIISRLERVGIKLVAAKVMQADKAMLDKHYPASRTEFIVGLGNKTIENYQKLGIDLKKDMGTEDALEIGMQIRQWLVDYMMSGPVFAMVWEGPHVIEIVRKLCGPTLCLNAAPGTIRGDFSYDSSYLANTNRRPIKNLMHASGNVEEATYEIPLWFSKNEIHSYERVEEKAMK